MQEKREGDAEPAALLPCLLYTTPHAVCNHASDTRFFGRCNVLFLSTNFETKKQKPCFFFLPF